MRFIASSAPQVPLFNTILNAQPKFGEFKNLPEVCAYLADRFLGGAERPPEPLTISGAGEDPPTIIDFEVIRDAQLTPEALGPAVLVHIAQHLVPALQRNGADAQAAQYAAMQIVAQLGDREFATLEQTAVQDATAHRMSGEPVSATHVALEPHGEVLVHKTTQWAGYVNDAGQTIEFGSEGQPVLKIDFVTGFWLERADSRIQQGGGRAAGAPMVFPNADGVKQFALHGKVQRCRLETPDAALKTMLTLRGTTLVDILLYGVARILGWAGIYIDPPGPLDNVLWERTRSQDPQDVMQQPPPNLLKVATHRVQASHSGTQERDAALAFGAYCQSLASRLLPYSYSKKLIEANQAEGERRDELLAQAESYGTIIVGIRNKSEFARYKSIACMSLLTNALKFSTGDCTEMALVTAALAQSNAKQFLSERGLANVEIKVEIYETKSHGDHAVCVMTLKFHGFTYKIAIDPWAEVSMLYEHYVDYVTTYPINPYIEKDTNFGVSESLSRTINQEYFMKQAPNILKKYLTAPGA